MDKNQLVSFLLRVGLATVFLYAAISAILDPTAWIGFIPVWIRAVIPTTTFLWVYNLYQIGLSLWLLSGKKSYYAAILSGLTLAAIVVLNIRALDLVFRDVAILFSAGALSVLSRKQGK